MSRPRRSQLPVEQNTQHGGRGPLPMGNVPQQRVRGTTVNCDAASHVYLVATPQGRVTMSRVRSSPGDVSLIPNGTPVMVDYSLGEPYIVGILPAEGRRNAVEGNEGITGAQGFGGADPLLSANYGVNARAGDEPADLIPGDSVMKGPGTSSVSALHGNAAVMQGGRLAQVRTFGDEDAVEIIAGVYRLLTWMGEARVINEDGKTSYVWRGGSDQLTQTGPDEERYPIRLDVGHTGDLINLEVCTPRGQTLFRFHVDGSGRLELYAAGGIDQTDCGGTAPVRVGGRRETDVRGDDVRVVGGACRTTCETSRRATVSTNDELLVGQDVLTTVGRDARLTTVGRALCRTGGDVELSSRGDVTVTTTGDAVINATTGTFTAKTGEVDGVKLGRNPSFHPVNYETFSVLWAALLADYNAFKALVIAHAHPVVLTPVPLAQQSPTIITAPFTADIGPAKNDDVIF